MARHRRAAPRDEATEVPRRVPAEFDLADARRAEGGDVPADLRWPAAAEHRHGWRRQRAATVRRLARSRRALRPHRRVPVGAARRADRAALRLRGPLLPRGRGDREPGARTASRSCTSVAPPAPRRWWPPSTSTSTSPGASRRRWSPRASPGCASSPPSRAGRCGSESACTSSPATGPRTPGPRPNGSSTSSTLRSSRRRRRRWRRVRRSASSGWCRCTAARATTW